jgi:hypothetical protein
MTYKPVPAHMRKRKPGAGRKPHPAGPRGERRFYPLPELDAWLVKQAKCHKVPVYRFVEQALESVRLSLAG